jgi:ABC-type multidrug transport system ATPase subunit
MEMQPFLDILLGKISQAFRESWEFVLNSSKKFEKSCLMTDCAIYSILWNELTGEEHLRLFAGLRNIPSGQLKDEVDRLLKVFFYFLALF